MLTQLPQLADELHTTDRTLRRAIREGLVRATRPSPRKVDLSLNERTYLRRAWPLLAVLREILRTEPSISLAVLFGSQARGDESAGSDVDLLVALRRDVNVRELASRLSDRVDRRVQLVTLEDASETPLLLREVLRDGRVLIDRDNLWPALAQRRGQVERAAERKRRATEEQFRAEFVTEHAS